MFAFKQKKAPVILEEQVIKIAYHFKGQPFGTMIIKKVKKDTIAYLIEDGWGGMIGRVENPEEIQSLLKRLLKA